MPVPDLTVEQTADALTISGKTVRQLANAGKFRGAYKTGKGGRTSPWRIPSRAVDLYRQSQPGGYRP